MTEQIRIVLAGPRGKMGTEALKMIKNTPHFKMVGVIDRENDGVSLATIPGFEEYDVPVFTSITECFQTTTPDVLVDLTNPHVGKTNTKLAVEHGVRAVVGTTGFSNEELDELSNLCDSKQVGCIIAPNFAIGAILMMKFAQMAAKYMPEVEIIELHHNQKLDAPSGTAIKTAQMIREVRDVVKQGHPDEIEILPGARGGKYEEIPIHSVRLQGLVAHQEVLFGAESQMLTIKHDSFHRSSFMSGIKLAVEQVMKLDVLVYGLDKIIE